jgi:hypothetical protein
LRIKKTELFFQGVTIFIYLFFVSYAPHSFSQQQQHGSGKETATAAKAITSSNHKCDSNGGDYQ